MDSKTTMAYDHTESSNNSVVEDQFHNLYDSWTMYAHLPHDTDWSIHSYKNILTMNNLEEGISLFEAIPTKMTQNCMLFLMKNNVRPTWEDPMNRKGGSFSFKVPVSKVHETWKILCYSIIGNTVSDRQEFIENITGITISPKRNFCIIKVWMRDCTITDVNEMNEIDGLVREEALFKKHNPEF